ncbi:hypothetical protein ACO0KY_19320 [Undibacterium sp. Dicai25W]|uniref:hypothetical protein n=1 Tax=Undibacterium sp. Dicai25W TaxID=3413034 RepID=UPI003BF1EBE4
MQIEITLTKFYAKGDERRLFQGLSEIAAVSNVHGRGRGLIFELNLRLLGKESLWELLALLYRYGISLAPFKVLASSKKFSWLDDKKSYWYKNMFSA